MTFIPEAFEDRMRLILQNEYEAFALSLQSERVQGLRFNTLKAPLDDELLSCGHRFGLRPVPWCREGFIFDAGTHPGRHPYHEAGVYYIQEPSAMAAVELMDVKPGEKILDLCAAPGGKSTQIAAALKGSGLLIANEIHPERAKILSRNIERMGIKNAVVLREDPQRLAGAFPGFFDKVLADVPCSGEGMFRKGDTAAAQWSEENVKRCAIRGQEILNFAAAMLRPGGTLLYSTCTFETGEDEGAVEAFLESHREFSLCRDVGLYGSASFSHCALPGAQTGAGADVAMYRLWPHRLEGEGHFCALLRKSEDAPFYPEKRKKTAPVFLKDKGLKSLLKDELSAIFKDDVTGSADGERLMLSGNDIYLVPESYPVQAGLSVIRCGLLLGSIRKGRFEPSHSLALASKPEDLRCVLDLDAESGEAEAYLKGDTLLTGRMEKNWVLICVDGYSLGWGRAVNGVIKNHYPKGLRAKALKGRPEQER